MDQLPFLNDPYISEISFFKKLENKDNKVKKFSFKENKILSPFFIYLKLKEVENKNQLLIKFYNEESEMVTKLSFQFGEDGKFYEYIIFTDKVSDLQAGTYRYTIFINKTLIYEDKITIEKKKNK